MSTELAIAASRPVPAAPKAPGRPPGLPDPARLSRKQKAAIVVRLLLAEGATLPLSELPEPLQAELTTQMSRMRYIDRETLRSVVEEFATELDSIGLAFPGGLEGTLALLAGAISPEMASRLRQQAGAVWTDDPWEVLGALEDERLLPLLQRESPEIAAVVLSKLKVARAAGLLGQLQGERARRLTLAMAETSKVAPQVVHRIGCAIAADLEAEPPRAFAGGAVDRLGEILNVSPAITREEILAGLEEEDAELAGAVRRAIFTFADIPARLAARDVPNVTKDVAQDDLVTAIAGADEKTRPATEFLLSNMSTRLAETLREEAGDRGAVTAKDAEEAQMRIVSAIRDAVGEGRIALIAADE